MNFTSPASHAHPVLADGAQTFVDAASPKEIPAYMKEVYDWAYVNPRNVEWLDRPIVVSTLLFLNDKRLMQSVLDEIEPGQKMLFPAHVYGHFCQLLADKIGPKGCFHLSDVTPIQVEHAHRKLDDRPWARVWQEDAATTGEDGDYDLISSFFLLHEVPDDKKREVIDNLLTRIRPGGKVVFVDYHEPVKWHPLRLLLSKVCDWLEPFAKAVWWNELRDFATHADDYNWVKQTFFGGVYQKVVVTRK